MESRDRIVVTIGGRMLTSNIELFNEGDISVAATSQHA